MGTFGYSNVFLSIDDPKFRQHVKASGLKSSVQHTFSLLYWLSKKEGYAFARQTTLASMLGISNRTVSSHISKLKKLGLISVVRRGAGQTAKYFVKSIKKLKQLIFSLALSKKRRTALPIKSAETAYQKTFTNYKGKNKVTPPLPPSGGQDQFALLCEHYPNRENLHKARRTFFRLLRKGRLPDLESLIKTIGVFRRTDSWQRGYIPQLWRFLRYERYSEALEAVQTAEAAKREAKVRLQKEKEKEARLQQEEEMKDRSFANWLESQSSFFLESLKPIKKSGDTAWKLMSFDLWLRFIYWPNYAL
ncbi:helix-turn-helix domain-containing protein [Desulforhopalus singaporensis]|uniref:Helix-turn-helix domain-containing protein n=1 Tax=Desulforhopalus singaporensis TaxID=91360 RepID=A0A1H0PB15_9BACT|nr:helix-turn-helix domain-containing protein [Desulforhopalus singaporensis]SDP02191.1 Helix-turn-helix domain-containing protein [Desulforhopalus singaporensis]